MATDKTSNSGADCAWYPSPLASPAFMADKHQVWFEKGCENSERNNIIDVPPVS